MDRLVKLTKELEKTIQAEAEECVDNMGGYKKRQDVCEVVALNIAEAIDNALSYLNDKQFEELRLMLENQVEKVIDWEKIDGEIDEAMAYAKEWSDEYRHASFN